MTAPENFAKVDERLWRGARPNPEQAAWLAAEGVRVALDLEWEESDAGLFPASIACRRILDWEPLPKYLPMVADHHVVSALAYIREGPVPAYVHCKSGQNRTGVIVAAYRLIERGEPLTAVLDDFRSFHPLWDAADSPYIASLPARREAFQVMISKETTCAVS